jgi:peptidoglycan L-alanyl-D-glutamate endopeptidase CwlK
VVELALHKCQIDFSIIETVRDTAQQRANIKLGVSWTMESKHLPDDRGLSRAVDIYPWVGGKTSHDAYHYRLVARAMVEAAIELGVQVRWGGLWSEDHFDPPHWEKI